MTQQAVSVSKNICSFLCDQKLFEELLMLLEAGLWGGFLYSFVSCSLLRQKHSCRFAVAWSPPTLKTRFPSNVFGGNSRILLICFQL